MESVTEEPYSVNKIAITALRNPHIPRLKLTDKGITLVYHVHVCTYRCKSTVVNIFYCK